MLAASVALVASAACTSSPQDHDRASASIAPSSAVTLKVMSFNIEYGGDVVDFDKVLEAIRETDPDIVGIQEAFGRVGELGKELGMHADPRVGVLAKGPILSPGDADGNYAYVEVSPGKVVAVSNLHLPSGNYGPRKILDGLSRPDAIAAEERYRVPPAREDVEPLVGLLQAGVPTFLTGDFNSPSFRDWPGSMVGERPQIRYPMSWPAIEVFEQAGFRDSYREVHPDPKPDPGLTWPAGRPRSDDSWNPPADAPQDRIDFVWGGGPVTAKESVIVGERGADGVSVAIDPWPSDHRAVLSTFEVEPTVPDPFVAVEQALVDLGSPVTVIAQAPDGGEVQLVAAGDPADGDVLVNGSVGSSSEGFATVTLATDGLSADAYDVVLLDPSGEELSRAPVWTHEPGAAPSMMTSRASYAKGEPIEVRWTGGPGNKFDWVGVYERGADPQVDSYLTWEHTGGGVGGDLTLDGDSTGLWPLPPGEYTVFLMADDDYIVLVQTDVEVSGDR
jgi:endonuclease/exonuclease/phosphatase family metal-dependent hydrolase